MIKHILYPLIVLLVVGCSPTVVDEATEPPITQEPTRLAEEITLTDVPTDAASLTPPTVPPTHTDGPPPPTATITATSFPPVIGGTRYVVQFVPMNDTLNVRAAPSAASEIVTELFSGERVFVVGEGETVGSDTWLPIREYEGMPFSGWVNGYYLVQDDPAKFCADARPPAILQQVRDAVRNHDGDALAALVSPIYGLTLRGAYSDTILHFTPDEMRTFFTDTTPINWLSAPYEEPLHGSIPEALVPLMEQDLLPETSSIKCMDNQDDLTTEPDFHSGMPGMYQLPFYSIRRAGSVERELDWRSWGFGFVPSETAMELVAVSYYVATP